MEDRLGLLIAADRNAKAAIEVTRQARAEVSRMSQELVQMQRRMLQLEQRMTEMTTQHAMAQARMQQEINALRQKG